MTTGWDNFDKDKPNLYEQLKCDVINQNFCNH